MEISSYSKIYNLGHKALDQLLDKPVLVEEKVDGSQFSFMADETGLHFRSRGANIDANAPGMFFKGVMAITELWKQGRLENDLIYRGEYLMKPKHNVLAYDRVPTGHVILFDIEKPGTDFFQRVPKETLAAQLGLEIVPLMFTGLVTSADEIREFLDRTSVLGGQKVEGVVLKPFDYNLFGADGKVVMGKFVSEAYKEVHANDWRKGDHAPGKAKVEIMMDEYRSEARWRKAVQHLRDAGTLLNEPKDIGALLIEIQKDLGEECKEEIKTKLWKIYSKDLMRTATRGFPEWYKQQLLEEAFDASPEMQETPEVSS